MSNAEPQTQRHPHAKFAATLLCAAITSGCGTPRKDIAPTTPPDSASQSHPPPTLTLNPRSGGDTTVFDDGINAFGHPAPSLSPVERRRFAVGNSFFKQNWVTAPASTSGRDGLGPLFNARSCSACHLRDGRSGPPDIDDGRTEGSVIRIRVDHIGAFSPVGRSLPHPIYGGQIQDHAVDGVHPEATINIAYEPVRAEFPDGEPYELLRPTHTLTNFAYGDPGDVHIGLRVAPHVIGMGLLEAIPERDIIANADPTDRNLDGISGKPHIRPNGLLGRFGWKAHKTTVREQVVSALVEDIGITTNERPHDQLTPRQETTVTAPNGGEPEMDAGKVDMLTFYSQTLAVPAQRDADAPIVRRGGDVFVSVGCSLCHIPEHRTGPDAAHPSLANQTIRPYTDLLLHDMGDDLATTGEGGEGRDAALPSEWRTPPLWGLGLVGTVNGHTRLLHDGRARNFTEAVLWHAGEAEQTRERFENLPADDRAALIAFLESL